MASDCGQSLVTCSDASASKFGLLHIQGYSANGTGTASVPIARQVQLSGAPSGCLDGYFTNPSGSCKLAVSATVDWGTSTKPTGADVDAVVGGTCYALTFKSTSGTNELWSSEASAPSGSCSGFKGKTNAGSGYVTLAEGAGATQIELRAKDSSATKTFTAVQRTYAASASSEPLKEAFLAQINGAPRDADSFRLCETGNQGEACTPKLTVTIGIAGSLGNAQSVSDPTYVMRFDGTGSQNQSVSCNAANGGSTFADTLASGCAGTWAVNPTLTCPDSASPQDCIPPATGNKQNQVAKGMNQRILGSQKPPTCTQPNLWKTFTFTNGVPSVSPKDPRVVTVFVTPYDPRIVTIVIIPFGSGLREIPIEAFATFYITGWTGEGNGFTNPCQSSGDDKAVPKQMVGHFIKYTTLDTSSGGTTLCEPNALGQCVAVLTR